MCFLRTENFVKLIIVTLVYYFVKMYSLLGEREMNGGYWYLTKEIFLKLITYFGQIHIFIKHIFIDIVNFKKKMCLETC